MAHHERENEMFKWRRIANGFHEARRNNVPVARAKRIKDTGEPLWQLLILDETPYSTTASGREVDTFPTLGEAQFSYGFNYRRANPE